MRQLPAPLFSTTPIQLQLKTCNKIGSYNFTTCYCTILASPRLLQAGLDFWPFEKNCLWGTSCFGKILGSCLLGPPIPSMLFSKAYSTFPPPPHCCLITVHWQLLQPLPFPSTIADRCGCQARCPDPKAFCLACPLVQGLPVGWLGGWS